MITRTETRIVPASHHVAKEFWAARQPGYANLCYISDPDDWHEILAAVTSQIACVGDAERPLRLLDIGSGTGTTIAAISQRLLATYKRSSAASLVEPSVRARAASRVLFSESDHTFGTIRTYSDVDGLPRSDKFDAVLYIHSTYYIGELSTQLRQILSSHVSPGGVVIVLALPQTSPFYLGRAERAQKNSAEAVVAIFADLDLATEVHTLTSRISVPPGLWEDDTLVADWRAFLGYGDWELERVRRGLRTHLLDGTDLADKLIVGKINR
jgi:SAM-dependent methyltransferase